MFRFGRKDRKENTLHGGQKTILRIEGMTCMHCKMSVNKALKSVEGVESVNVDFEHKEAIITGSAGRDALVQAVEDAGYSVAG